MKSSALAVMLNLPTLSWVSLPTASTRSFCNWVRGVEGTRDGHAADGGGGASGRAGQMEVSSPVAGGTVLRAWLPLPPEPPRLPLQPGA